MAHKKLPLPNKRCISLQLNLLVAVAALVNLMPAAHAAPVQTRLIDLPSMSNNPNTANILPALRRTEINDKWSDRATIERPTNSAPRGPFKLWYRQPAKVWEEALPLGNGSLGAMVFGGVADERLQLNEDTLWDGYPLDGVNPDALASLGEVRRLLFEGKNKEAETLASRTMMGRPAGVKSYQSLGELWMETPGLPSVSDYSRSLDLNTAITSVHYQYNGVNFNREIFASAPAGVIVARFTADQPGQINLRLTLKRQQDAVCTAHPTLSNRIVLRVKLIVRTKKAPNAG